MTVINGEKKKRLPRIRELVNPEELPGMYLTDRDKSILVSCGNYRVLSTDQIEALLFNGANFSKLVSGVQNQEKPHKTRCSARVQLLYHHGFLERIEQSTRLSEGRKPYLYFLSQKGLNYLTFHEIVEDGAIQLVFNKDYTQRFIEHMLNTNTVRIAVELGLKNLGGELVQWIDERQLKHDHAHVKVRITGDRGAVVKASIIPDAYFTMVLNGSAYNFFVELDRATETGQYATFSEKDFAFKMKAYGAFFTPSEGQKSMFEQMYGTERCRVLTITTGPKRTLNLKTITERVGGKSRFWFTFMREIGADTILTGKIWQISSRPDLYSIVEGK